MKSNTALELYNLIHSLTPSEKSYFKKGLSKRSDGKLGELFELFNKKKNYDQKQLLGEIKPKYVNPSDVCLKLINAILRSMARYRADSSAQSELNTMLTQIEFLHKRRLYPIGERLTRKALKLSKENNHYAHTNILLDRLLDFIPKRGKDKLKNIQIIQAELKSNTQHQTMYQSLRVLNALMLDHITNHKPSRESLKRFINEILISELMITSTAIDKEYKGLKVYAQNTRNGALYYHGDWETALAESQALIQILGPVEKLSDRLYKSWLSINFNIMTLACLLLDGSTYNKVMKQVDDARKKRGQENDKLGNISFELLNTVHLINLGKLDDAFDILTTQLNQLYNPDLSRHQDESNLRISIGQVLFYQENYAQALAELNKWLADETIKKSEEITNRARWLEMLSVYMLGDLQLFESKLLAMHRYIKQKDTGFDWQIDLLNTMRKTIGESVKNRRSAFTELHQKVKQHQMEFRATAHGFNLLYFIEASALGMPMNKFMAKRYSNN